MTIEDRLSIYGRRPQWHRAYCPLCEEVRETVFFKVADELVCRRHPGHPLFEAGEAGEDELTSLPTRSRF